MLEQLFPLEDEYVCRFVGLPVDVTTHDGERYSGILSYCGDGSISLNGGESVRRDAYVLNKESKKPKKKAQIRKKKDNKKRKADTLSLPFDPLDYEIDRSDRSSGRRSPDRSGRSWDRSWDRSWGRIGGRFRRNRFFPFRAAPFRRPVTLDLEEIAFLLVFV